MPREARDEHSRSAPELRSELLRTQLRRWTDEVETTGRAGELFELEMWLRSFERFFRIGNQPLSEREARALALRNWSEELRLVDHALMRVVHLCSSILTEEHVDLTRFDRYIETSLARDEALDPYIEKLVRHTTPESALELLRESFEDLHVLLLDLVQLSRLPYATFTAVGKLIYREVRRSDLLALLIDKKFKPVHDRIRNPTVAALILGIRDPFERRQAAKVFLEFFRLLHYLEYTDPQRLGDEELRDTVLLFSLITSEARLLLSYVEKRVLRGRDVEQPLYSLYDSFVYCVPLELKKVINTELTDISVARHSENVRTRVENSHGILKDCFQQSIVQLAQVFEPRLEGGRIFPDFTAKREQSIHLRDALAGMIKAVREFQLRKDEPTAERMKNRISEFYDHQIKYLMYRDWSGFELFYIEILKCGSLTALAQIAHRFETFLVTLFREVQKRSILQGAPVNAELADVVPGV
ncbi:MAG: hypothetical protein A2V74_08660 [Acidobacteria bacterium RBG_16_70_10]|nr:MAG: hypothetical protein A2V74_08660 [Acidobacteria bacterium RBG_16_70_10]